MTGLSMVKRQVKVAVRESMRMLGRRHEPEEIDDVDEADLQVGEALLQNRDGCERLLGGNIARAWPSLRLAPRPHPWKPSPRCQCPLYSGLRHLPC